MKALKFQYRTWDDQEVTLTLGPGRHRIGRTPDNDVVIDELAVSEHHCVVIIEEGAARIADADSIPGTFLDGVPIQNETLNPGQTINLGTLMIKVLAAETNPGIGGGKSRSESVPLKDGSYSCLIHQDRRAEYECPSCFHLFCASCLKRVQESVTCPSCGKNADTIDWSGLEMTPRDAAYELMPDSMKKAWGYWKKWQDHREKSSDS